MNSAGEQEPSGSSGWPGVGVRLLATLFSLFLIVVVNRCTAPGWRAAPPTVTGLPSPTATARLRVEVRPAGAAVRVDGLRSGHTPVTLDLPPGRHAVRVEMEGYAPLEQTVILAIGEEAALGGDLLPLASPTVPTPTATVPPPRQELPLPDLVVRSVRIELETGGDCHYSSTNLGLAVVIQNAGQADAGPFVVEANGVPRQVGEGLVAGQEVRLWFEGYSFGGENRVAVDVTSQVGESDETNNTFSQRVPVPTLPPTCTPVPITPPTSTPVPITPPTSTPVPITPPTPRPQAVTVRQGQVTIATYPYARFITQGWNETFHMPYAILDRAAYDASRPVPVEVTYRTLVVENEYLQLTFLPEVGGRLYEVVFKPTGHRQTYRNPVLKPAPWGPAEQGWWLAAGGFEWCLPVEEHGYEWGVPWQIATDQDATGVTVTLRDSKARDRVRAIIAVRLEAGAGYFTLRPRLENPTAAPLAVKYWTNAMLAPGGRNAPSADLRFVLPQAVTAVTVHSRGDDRLPEPNQRLSWPLFGDVDLSRLGNWNRWLGFFEDPAVGHFIAVYDEGYDEGMVRIFPPEGARGAKLFAFGWNDPIPADNWTDDGSSYVEIHGGPASTFADSVTLPAGGHLQWTETWYPVAGLGGLRYANEVAALNLSVAGERVQVAAMTTRAWSGVALLLLDGQERWRQEVSLLPGEPFRQLLSFDGALQGSRLTFRLEAPDGTVVAEYRTDL